MNFDHKDFQTYVDAHLFPCASVASTIMEMNDIYIWISTILNKKG